MADVLQMEPERREGPVDDGDDEEIMRGGARTGRRRRIWKTVTAAITLFAIGSVMLYLGVTAYNAGRAPGGKESEKDRGLAMIIVGAIAFLPGSYASFVLLGASLGWDGYTYDSVPSYDDDD